MYTRLRACLALALALPAMIASAQTAQQPQQPRVIRITTTYSCGSSPAGQCPFLLYTSDCKEAGARNGHPSLVCTHEVFAEFSLKPGESKTFDRIPPGVKQCQPRNGRLVFPDCML
ncbi:hypothetical protein [Massilia sp. LjRoot122]|uniref:hypothetical protein n=1 Tax=Massilia sp. LjRoot122 TaxID=3342257 RepID=UPI003ECDEEE9